MKRPAILLYLLFAAASSASDAVASQAPAQTYAFPPPAVGVTVVPGTSTTGRWITRK